MIVRRQGLAELREFRTRIGAVGQIAQHLIERAVLFHDVDHVLDMRVEEVHHFRVFLVGRDRVEVVHRDPGRQLRQLIDGRHGRAHERRALQLKLVLVRCPRGRGGPGAAACDAGGGAGQMVGVRSGGTFPAHHIHPRAIRAECDVMRLYAVGMRPITWFARGPAAGITAMEFAPLLTAYNSFRRERA